MIGRAASTDGALKKFQIRAGTASGLGSEVAGYFEGPGENKKRYGVDFGRTIMAEYVTVQTMVNEAYHMLVSGIRLRK